MLGDISCISYSENPRVTTSDDDQLVIISAND